VQADLKTKLIYVAPRKVSTGGQPQPTPPFETQYPIRVSAVSAAGNLNSIDTQIDNLMRDKEAMCKVKEMGRWGVLAGPLKSWLSIFIHWGDSANSSLPKGKTKKKRRQINKQGNN